MSELGVEFEDEYQGSDFHIRSRRLLGEKTTPSMVSFVMNKGIVKTEKQAVIFLSILIGLFLLLSVFIIRTSLINNEPLRVVDKYGRTIPFEEYVDALAQGTDLLQ